MRMEIYRLFHNRKLLCGLLVLLILQVVLFLYQNPFGDVGKIQQIKQEQESHRNTYHTYVSEVIDDANRIVDSPLFGSSNSEFYKSNASNIAKAYDSVKNIQLESGNDLPIIAFIEFSIMPYIALIMVIIIAFDVVREQKKGMSYTIYALPKGRGLLGIRRCSYLVFMSGVIVALNMLVLLCLSVLVYGGNIDFNRNVQSISLFRDFTYCLSIKEFLLRYYFLLVLIIAVIGIFVWACMSMISHFFLSMVSLCIVFLTEYSWMKNITPQSNLRLLKYINILECLDIKDYLFKYYDISISNQAINVLWIIKFGMLLLFLLFSVIGIVAFARRIIYIEKRSWGIQEMILQLQEHYSLVLTELQKLLFGNNAIYVIIIALVFSAGIASQRNIVYTEVEKYINDFYENYSGEITEETFAYVEREHAYVEAVYERFEEISAKYKKGEADKMELINVQSELNAAKVIEDGLQIIEAELIRAERLQIERGIQMHLFNNSGYNKLFGDDGRFTQISIMLICLFTYAIVFSGNFKYENETQSNYLLRTTPRGRKELLHAKEWMVFIIASFVYASLHMIHLYYIVVQYGLPEIMAPVHSVAILQNFPFEISIFSFIVCLWIVRGVIYILLGECLLHLSVLIEQKWILIGFAVIVILPILLNVRMISYFDLLHVNGIIMGQVNILNLLVKTILLMVAVVITKIFAYKRWCG